MWPKGLHLQWSNVTCVEPLALTCHAYVIPGPLLEPAAESTNCPKALNQKFLNPKVQGLTAGSTTCRQRSSASPAATTVACISFAPTVLAIRWVLSSSATVLEIIRRHVKFSMALRLLTFHLTFGKIGSHIAHACHCTRLPLHQRLTYIRRSLHFMNMC